MPKNGTQDWLGFPRLRQPKWIYQVEWPQKPIDLRRSLRGAEQREIVSRLLAYLMYPPPSPRRAGGRRKDQNLGSLGSRKGKQSTLRQEQLQVRDNIISYLAYMRALQLAAEERKAGHIPLSPKTRYSTLLVEFRQIEGFSRLVAGVGNRLSRPSMAKRQWRDLLGAFNVFDLFDRMRADGLREAQMVLSETTALHIVLLRQTSLGLKFGHSTLAEACRSFRPVAHLLVGLFTAERGTRTPDEWSVGMAPRQLGLQKLIDLLSPVAAAAISNSRGLQRTFGTSPIPRKGTPLVPQGYQVRLPDYVKAPRVTGVIKTLQQEEIRLVRALKSIRDLKRRGIKIPAPILDKPIQSLSANSSDAARKALLEHEETLHCSKI